MKNLKLFIAVLATAALSLVAFNSINAADSFSPSSSAKGIAVSVNSSTHVQVNPSPYFLLRGWSGTGNVTNALSSTGTNFVATPIAPLQEIVAAGNVNFVDASNVVAGSAWKTLIAIQAGTTNRVLGVPATWNQYTNAQVLTFYTTNVVGSGKYTLVPSNTIALLEIQVIDTNVLFKAETFRP